MTEANYLAILEASYEEDQAFEPERSRSRLSYLADEIFDFTTYDDGIAEEFAAGALDVCEAINDKKTFEFIKDEAKYRWYLLMCNMPFFASRLEWGTSVRGAWWSAESGVHLVSGNFHIAGKLVHKLPVPEKMWSDFVRAMVRFGRA